MRQTALLPRPESASTRHTFHQWTRLSMVVRPKACGNVTMVGVALSSAPNPISFLPSHILKSRSDCPVFAFFPRLVNGRNSLPVDNVAENYFATFWLVAMTRVIGIPKPCIKFCLTEPFVYQLTHWFPCSLRSIKFYEAFSPTRLYNNYSKLEGVSLAFNVLSIVQGHLRKKTKKNILIFNVLSIILRHLSKKKEFLRLTTCHLYIVT